MLFVDIEKGVFSLCVVQRAKREQVSMMTDFWFWPLSDLSREKKKIIGDLYSIQSSRFIRKG